MYEAAIYFIETNDSSIAQREAAFPLTMKVCPSLPFSSRHMLTPDPTKGECKPTMIEYLACLKRVRGVNDPECRLLAKAYLKCRMDRSVALPYLYVPLGVEEKGKGKIKEEKDRETRLYG